MTWTEITGKFGCFYVELYGFIMTYSLHGICHCFYNVKISKEQLLFVHLFYQHREPIAYFFDCFPTNSPTNSPVCYRNIVLLAVLFALGQACGIMLLISLESRPLHDSLFKVLGFNP